MYIKIQICISRFKYMYEDSNIYIKIQICISRFKYIYQDSNIYNARRLDEVQAHAIYNTAECKYGG